MLPYIKGQVVKPITQGVKEVVQSPTIKGKVVGAARIAGGVSGATPVGALWNAGTGLVAGTARSIRTKQPLLSSVSQAINEPTSIASEGLGITNPALAIGTDLLLSHGLAKGAKGLSSVLALDKGAILENVDSKTIAKLGKKMDDLGNISIKETEKVFDLGDKYLKVPKKELARMGTADILAELRGLMNKNQTYAYEELTNKMSLVGRKESMAPARELAASPQVEEALDPVQKIINALKEAKPLRNQQEALYSAERSKRVARVAAMGEKVSGEQGYFAQLGQLKGELPKVEFESIRQQIGQPDIDGLFNKIEQTRILTPFEKVSAKAGLAKLLGAEGGSVPTNSELKLLNDVFPPEFVQSVLDKRPLMQKLFSLGAEALNLPRAMMATADLSAPLRQGVFLIGRPKTWIPAFKDMFKYAFSEDAYKGLTENIQARPTYKLMRENKLALTDMGPNLLSREEAFMSGLAEKIPIFGRLAKGSNRAYSGFLNKLRADTFDDLYRAAKEQDLVTDNPKLVSDIAKFVNSATGRGDLGALSKASVVLNSAFFSPRLLASRINLLNPAYYVKLDPFVRKEALKSLFTFAGTGMTILGLAKLGGASVGTDPRSADFGKIKVGDTRYDIWGGFQQYLVLASRLLTGEMVSSTTGKEIQLGEGYKPTTRFDIIQRFLESKEAPVLSFITALLKGQTSVGEKFNLPVEVVDRFIPMMAQDMYDLFRERGPQGIAMAIPGAFGVGSQTYTDQIPMAGKTASGRPNVQWRQAPGLGEAILNKVTGKELSNIPQEQWGPLVEEKKAKTMQTIDVNKAKAQVLATGEPQTVGDKYIYLDNGIVKTKKTTTKAPSVKKVRVPKVKKAKSVKVKKVKIPKLKTAKIKSVKLKSYKVKQKKLTAYKMPKAGKIKKMSRSKTLT